MLIPPKYILTPKIAQLLASIEASKEVIDSITIPPEIETNIRRQSVLKSSLFSARIEGSELTLQEVENSSLTKSQKKIEVYNILRAINWVKEKANKDLKIKDILKLHEITMEDLVDKQNLGKFRKNMEAIFNNAGIAVYIPPPPRQIESLIINLLKFINGQKEPFVPIKACLSHYSFEKIHPFLDGSGRVGRLLLQKILSQEGYGMKGLLPLEEYVDNHRSEYYRGLEDSERNVTNYLEFMLEAISETAIKTKNQVLQKKEGSFVDTLLPRRAEIYNIIKDHQLVNFDFIRRRFITINERTLRYDLKKLQDAGLIRKRGTTKGVYYEIITS